MSEIQPNSIIEAAEILSGDIPTVRKLVRMALTILNEANDIKNSVLKKMGLRARELYFALERLSSESGIILEKIRNTTRQGIDQNFLKNEESLLKIARINFRESLGDVIGLVHDLITEELAIDANFALAA